MNPADRAARRALIIGLPAQPPDVPGLLDLLAPPAPPPTGDDDGAGP